MSSPYINIKNIILIALLLISSDGAAAGDVDSEQRFKNANESLLTITTDLSRGTGFVLDSSGDFVTNYHVIRKARKISVKHVATGNTYTIDKIKIRAVDSIRDLAVLNISGFAGFTPGTGPAARKTSSTEDTIIDIRKGIYAQGYSLVTDLHQSTISRGIISGRNTADTFFNSRNFKKVKNNNLIVLFDARVNVGSSGGMLLDESGEIVAVITGAVGKEEYLGFAVPIEYVNKLLETTPNILTPFKGFEWKDHESSNDNYYLSHLYKEVVVPNTTAVAGRILDFGNHQGVRFAKILISDEQDSQNAYKRLIYTNHLGRFHARLPIHTGKSWYLTVKQDTYETTKYGPLIEADDFQGPHFLKLRKELANKITAIVEPKPSKIELSAEQPRTEYTADIYNGSVPSKKKLKWTITSQIPDWLVVDKKEGKINSGEQGNFINFNKNKSFNSQLTNQEYVRLTVSNRVDDVEMPEKDLTIYADRLPATRNLRISGRLFTEDYGWPSIPVPLGATVDGDPIEFEAVAYEGRFETFTDMNAYQNKNIKLVIESPLYTTDLDDPALIVNESKKWFTKIKLKSVFTDK